MGDLGHELVAAVMKIAAMAPATKMEGPGCARLADDDA